MRSRRTSPTDFTDEDPDLDFDGAVGIDGRVTDAWQPWRHKVAHAREVCARYDDSAKPSSGGPWEARGVIVHMMEEYARQGGHAEHVRSTGYETAHPGPDQIHQPLDPIIVAGPWLLAVWGTYKVGKRVAKLVR